MCERHTSQPIIYVCGVNQNLLCAKCILEPFYVDKLQSIKYFNMKET